MMNHAPPISSPERVPDTVFDEICKKEVAELDTDGLYLRIQYELEKRGLTDNWEIQRSLHVALDLHKDQKRTDGPYVDHIMRVGLAIMVDLEVNDPETISAAFFHDSPEDHPKKILASMPPVEASENERQDAIEAMRSGDFLSSETLTIIEAVTCPEFEGANRNEQYYEYVVLKIMPYPKARLVKLADFLHNAVGNHNSKEPLRTRLDLKYLPLYDVHLAALDFTDSLVPVEVRGKIRQELVEGKQRAMERILNAERLGYASIRACANGVSIQSIL